MAIAISSTQLLHRQQFINLTTFRRNGEPVSSPVNFATYEGKVYVITGRTSWKVKRIEKDPYVRIIPCDWNGKPLGDTIKGKARILPEAEAEALRGKLYFVTPAIIRFILNGIRAWKHNGTVCIEIYLV
jgi:PPOX class probable F420-dependent enzyme